MWGFSDEGEAEEVREFRWLTAFSKEKCVMCWGQIPQGEGFYYEVGKKEAHCRACGRLIRSVGYEKAEKERGFAAQLMKGLGL